MMIVTLLNTKDISYKTDFKKKPDRIKTQLKVDPTAKRDKSFLARNKLSIILNLIRVQ